MFWFVSLSRTWAWRPTIGWVTILQWKLGVTCPYTRPQWEICMRPHLRHKSLSIEKFVLTCPYFSHGSILGSLWCLYKVAVHIFYISWQTDFRFRYNTLEGWNIVIGHSNQFFQIFSLTGWYQNAYNIIHPKFHPAVQFSIIVHHHHLSYFPTYYPRYFIVFINIILTWLRHTF